MTEKPWTQESVQPGDIPIPDQDSSELTDADLALVSGGDTMDGNISIQLGCGAGARTRRFDAVAQEGDVL
jgi:hypothetical protein